MFFTYIFISSIILFIEEQLLIVLKHMSDLIVI